MKYFFTLIFLLCLLTNNSTAQKVTQTLRGTVVDAVDNLPLKGATVYLSPSEITFGVVTDRSGSFRFDSIPVGRYQLKISYVGYKTILLSEVSLESGKESVKHIAMELGTEDLNEVVVVAGRPSLSPLSVQTITAEQTQRYAATFYDPGRLVTAFAGVINQNDQANNIVVRGNSPTSTVWWLEGAEIVNPNHTANAGTVSDRVMPNGGGVNILSAQLLGDSYFFNGNYPTQYGNGLGGILDMRMRKGNEEQREYTAQIGLIGIDLAAEGPFHKDYAASYLVNYRYSTLGLLSQMGVQLGDEEVAFQDLSFNVSLPTKKFGNLTIFGMAGSSSNFFEAERDTAVWDVQKDRQDINFTSRMGALGVTYNVLFAADKALWKTTFVVSSANSEREAFRLNEDYTRRITDVDERQETKVSFASMLQYRFSDKATLKTGLNATQYIPIVRAGKFITEDSVQIFLEGSSQNWLYRPYVNLQYNPITRLQFNIGAAYAYYAANGTNSVEPLFSVKYNFKHNQSLSFAYRLQAQLQAPTVYFGANITSDIFFPDDGESGYNEELEMTKAHHLGLAYQTNILDKLNINAELYYQSLFDVPIINNGISTFSALNLLDEIIQDTLISEGTGRNYGLEVTLQKFMENGYYLLLTSTIYESKYTAADGIERDTRFNGNYALALSGGKEFQWQSKKGNTNVLGINIKMVYLGGFRSTPIDITQSVKLDETVFIENRAFSEQLPNYFKTDFRVYFKKSRPKYTTTLALDLQNMTNHQNVAYDYFDTQQGAVVTRYQLGLIPLLVYRVAF
ncbi:MAG: hypothetical protein ACJA1N_000328 [Saprospiraceae bacterium]|jgi:hypothetical protein